MEGDGGQHVVDGTQGSEEREKEEEEGFSISEAGIEITRVVNLDHHSRKRKIALVMQPSEKQQQNTTTTLISDNVTHTNIQKCEICGQNDSKYCCPRCNLRTCCLACCKQHKTAKNCNGQRDVTAFVPLEKFTDATLCSGE